MSRAMEAAIAKYGIGALWHFTDRANLPSIRAQEGLLSLREIERRGIMIPRPGGDVLSHRLDRQFGLDGYVRLCFTTTHPMEFRAREEGRIVQTQWLRIDPSLLLQPDVRFSLGVAYMQGVELIDPERAAVEIDFDVIYTRTDWTDPEIQARRQAGEKTEVLIPGIVPINKIRLY